MASTTKTPFAVSVRKDVVLADTDVADLLVSALEGGSNYWIEKMEIAVPMEGFGTGDVGKDDYYPRIIRVPMSGGVLRVYAEDDDGAAKALDRTALLRGLELLARLYPKRFDAVVDGSYDADDGDVFLQLALFGEIVYG